MPTYQYACTTCGHRFEAAQSFTDATLTECPECTGRLRKVFSSVGIVFKGSGFYRTDSRSGSGAPSSEKKEKKSEPATTSGSGDASSSGSSSGSSSSSGSTTSGSTTGPTAKAS